MSNSASPASTAPSAQTAKVGLLAGLVSEDDLCLELEICPRTARRMTERGELHLVLIARRRYYDLAKSRQLLLERAQGPRRRKRKAAA